MNFRESAHALPGLVVATLLALSACGPGNDPLVDSSEISPPPVGEEEGEQAGAPEAEVLPRVDTSQVPPPPAQEEEGEEAEAPEAEVLPPVDTSQVPPPPVGEGDGEGPRRSIGELSSRSRVYGNSYGPGSSSGGVIGSIISSAPRAPTPVRPGPRGPSGARPQFHSEEYGVIREAGFVRVTHAPLSTFSIDVDSASYANVRRFLRHGTLPPPDAVRIEEMVNYFDYDYPVPVTDHPFSIVAELDECPWEPSHQLVQIGLRSRAVETASLPPSNLVFLIDVSGSMSVTNKLPLLKKSFAMLIEQLRPQDRVSVVVYAGAAGMVLPPTAGSQKARVLATLSRLEAGGSTAGAEGIRLAYQLAREGFLKDGNNRVVLATDGDFNIGVTSEGELVRLIEKEREGGVYLTVLGFGTGNLQDAKMEQLADHGNGHYAYIDTLLEARRVLVEQMGATLLTVAKDVKLQVEFNPAQVKAYRLLGYENRRLRDEEFNDDRRDAGDMGAGHSVTALYEVIPVGSDEAVPGVDPLKYQRTAVRESAAESDEVLTVKLRYKRPEESESHLLVQVVRQPDSDGALPSDAFLFSSAVAEFGLLLRDSPYKGEAQYVHAYDRAVEALGRDEGGRRSELLSLIQTARSLAVEPKTMRESPDGDG